VLKSEQMFIAITGQTRSLYAKQTTAS